MARGPVSGRVTVENIVCHITCGWMGFDRRGQMDDFGFLNRFNFVISLILEKYKTKMQRTLLGIDETRIESKTIESL